MQREREHAGCCWANKTTASQAFLFVLYPPRGPCEQSASPLGFYIPVRWVLLMLTTIDVCVGIYYVTSGYSLSSRERFTCGCALSWHHLIIVGCAVLCCLLYTAHRIRFSIFFRFYYINNKTAATATTAAALVYSVQQTEI